jgi:hypothetical protein
MRTRTASTANSKPMNHHALAKDKVDPAILKTVPWCLTIYALGVTASATMMYCAMMHADKWNFYWYYLAYTADTPSAVESEKRRTIGKTNYVSRSWSRWLPS